MERRIATGSLYVVVLAMCFCLWGQMGRAWAASLYVSDTTLEANLRTGTQADNRIIALLRPGTKVTLLEEQRGWAKVALEDGRTGWILRRYLSERVPWRLTAEKLAAEKERLQQKLHDLKSLQQKLAEENSRLKKLVLDSEKDLQTAQKAYKDLREGASNYLKLKDAYEGLQKQALAIKEKLAQAQKGYEKLQGADNIRWFLSGAGVLLFGWLLGIIMGRARRRRKADLYRL
ncbi:MAG: TIGR04211 family SH3 domain-containing protein [Deltaproteobacteria bacterium]|nr:TIGR04211 family SH3 domain-containing protein [Deltaproteobacteria bacterium]MBW2071389.1 TIGR04211 family SH3 domain-containing protein [Deltaproteobacteria bacterium]